MNTSFETFPLEIYHALEDYLTLTDIILLSQSTTKLRQIFGAMSWETCKLLTSDSTRANLSENRTNIIITSSPSHEKGIRAIPFQVFHNPSTYSWFRSHCVKKIVFHDLHTLICSMNGFSQSALIDVLKLYPQLKRLTFTSHDHPHEWKDVLQCHFAFSYVKNALDCQLYLAYEMYTEHLSLEHDQRFKAFELNVNLRELTITNWGTQYHPENLKYCNFKPDNLKQLKISVVDPLELGEILSRLRTLRRCERLIITMLYIFTKLPNSNTLITQYTIDTLRCLNNIPNVSIKNVELNISKLSALFYLSSKHFFHYPDQYQQYLETANRKGNRLVIEPVTCITGAFEHREYLDKFATFPNLYQCLSLSDMSMMSSHLPTNHLQLYCLDAITILDLSNDNKCYRLFLAISQFINVKHLKFRIHDNISLFAKEVYKKYITQMTYVGFMPVSSSNDSEDFIEFVQNIGSIYYPQIQDMAQHIKTTYLDAFNAPYSSHLIQDPGSCTWRLFFMDCFIYNLRNLPALQQVKVEAIGTQRFGRLFFLRLQELMNTHKKMRNLSVKLMYNRHVEGVTKTKWSGMDINDFVPQNTETPYTVMNGLDCTEKEYYHLLEYYPNSV